MYPYFAARALGIKVPSKFAKFITTLQFTQMVIGFTVNMTSMYYQRKFYFPCHKKAHIFIVKIAMFLTSLCVVFYLHRNGTSLRALPYKHKAICFCVRFLFAALWKIVLQFSN